LATFILKNPPESTSIKSKEAEKQKPEV